MISVIIATFGDEWIANNQHKIQFALWSAKNQTLDDVEVIRTHEKSLHEARNLGAQKAKGSRLVFLDGDDWLHERFCENIVEPEDVLQPLTKYKDAPFSAIGTAASYLEPRADLIEGNHLIVGCPVKRELFLDVGGFDDWPVYEDWALWLKMRKAGATFGKTTGIYYVRYNFMGRNQDPRGPETYDTIRRMYS